MNDQIICPNCKKPIPLTQAISHQLKEKLEKEKNLELEEEKKKLNTEAQIWRVEQRKKIEERLRNEAEYKLKDVKNEAEELKKQNKSLQEQLLELNKLMRQLRVENGQRRIEMEKKLAQGQEKIRQEEAKRLDEEYRLKTLEREKRLQDALRVNEELKRKLEQGSQQAQGEVLELELENILKKEFPFDEIKQVPKGIRGADVLQVVKNNFGRVCGTIVWESKRTKNWTDSWILKLKEDQRQVKAEIAVIISQVLPEGIKNFGMINDVWVGDYHSIIGLAVALRHNLINLASVKLSIVGKQEKKEILWNYLTGIEFKQRVEAIYEAYNQLQADLEIEKRWFTKKWAKQEKNIRMVIDNILGMHGDLQSIVGKVLSEIKGLDMLSSGETGKKHEDKLF